MRKLSGLLVCQVLVFAVPCVAIGQDCPGSAYPGRNLLCGIGPGAIAAGDLNGDGVTDLFVANFSDYTVQLLDPAGQPSSQTTQFPPLFRQPSEVVLGDIDGDGDLDAALVSFSDNEVGLLLNRGSGSVVAFVAAVAPPPPPSCQGCADQHEGSQAEHQPACLGAGACRHGSAHRCVSVWCHGKGWLHWPAGH